MDESIKRIVSLDPGGTTGWVTWTSPAKGPEEFTCGQFGPDEHHKRLFSFLEDQHIHQTVVVCESFEFRQNRQRDNINLMSREYIGVTKLFGQERNVPVVFQTAGAAKAFVTDQKIKAMGLWAPGYKHAMDAMRHLITYMVQKQERYDLIKCWKDL